MKETNKLTKKNTQVLAQRPNGPIIVALLAAAVHIILGSGLLADIAFVVFIISLTIWAILEIVQGASGFRKALGWLGLVVAAASLYKILAN